ncbi:MAG: thiamine-phosphate synthase family protein [Natronomonas sp.]
MSLYLPSEIVVERVLPTLRLCIIRELVEREFTQQEIADHLGVTQAAVSKYVSGDITVEKRIRDHPRTHETVERIGEGLSTGDMDQYDALAELLGLVELFEDRGPICELHEEEMPALRGLGCDLCVRGTDDGITEEREILRAVRRAARILSTAPGMAEYIPHVGTNLGYALPGASESTDVAAIPGRVYATNDRVEVPANPEFGASKHVATVLLAAMSIDPEVRGALNIATDDAILHAARDLDIEPMQFDADYEHRGEHLRDRFSERGRVPRVLYHRGAFGIEPITYVLGETVVDAARLAGDLVDASRTGSRS